ncbi:MAG TPA: hypothetical protein VFQ53_12605 [Kofleriaceae bacterium]|nr:hypothetical protein [Kofleriaceae bacterium]
MVQALLIIGIGLVAAALVALATRSKKPVARVSSTGVSGQPRRHHYRFAHAVLRDLALHEPDATWHSVTGTGVGDFLIGAWLAASDGLAAHERVSPTGLRVTINDKIGGGWRAAVIHMPTPENPTEAHMIALLHRDPSTVRYFVLERGFPQPNGQPRAYWAEWRPDMRVRGGDVAEISEDGFLLEVTAELVSAAA